MHIENDKGVHNNIEVSLPACKVSQPWTNSYILPDSPKLHMQLSV